MSLQYNEIEYCKDKVHFVADLELVEQKRSEAVKQCKKLTVPGYRPGKAPDFAIKVKMKDQIEKWMKQELQVAAFDSYLFESKVKPIGFPIMQQSTLHDSEFWCEFVVLKKPKFELKQYKDLEIPRPHRSSSPIEVAEQMIQELRQQHSQVTPYQASDTVALGDQITIFRTGLGDDTSIMREEDQITITDSEFDTQLIGMKIDDCRTFSLLPEGLDTKITWTIKLCAGAKVFPHPLDDELANKAGFQSYEALYSAYQAQASKKMEAVESTLVSQQLIRQILAQHDFEVPQWLLTMEAQQLALGVQATWSKLSQKETFLSQAKDNIKLALIMDSIREVEPETVFTNSEILNVVRQHLLSVGQNPDKFLVEAQHDGRLLGIMEGLRNDAVLQWLVQHNKIVD